MRICFPTIVSDTNRRFFILVVLADGCDPLVSRIDLHSLDTAPLAQNPLTAVAVNMEVATASVLVASFDSNDSDCIYALVKDGNENYFLQRWEYRPVYITASDSFSWLVNLNKQSPTAETNFVRRSFPALVVGILTRSVI